MGNLSILSKKTADNLYSEMIKIIEQKDRQPFDKLISICSVLEKLYKSITSGEIGEDATLFDRQEYIHNKWSVPEDIQEGSNKIRKSANKYRHEGEIPEGNYYLNTLEALKNCINYYSNKKIPSELKNIADKINKNQKTDSADYKNVSNGTNIFTYTISINNFQSGPFTLDHIKDKIMHEEISENYYISQNETSERNWIPIIKIPELQTLFREYNQRKEQERQYQKEKEDAQKRADAEKQNSQRAAQAAEAAMKRAERAEQELASKRWEVEREERIIREKARNKKKISLIIQIIVGIVLVIFFWSGILTSDGEGIWFGFLPIIFTINRIYVLIHFDKIYKKKKRF